MVFPNGSTSTVVGPSLSTLFEWKWLEPKWLEKKGREKEKKGIKQLKTEEKR